MNVTRRCVVMLVCVFVGVITATGANGYSLFAKEGPDYESNVLLVDTNRDGVSDCKVLLVISNKVTGGSVGFVCSHLISGAGFWSLDVTPVKGLPRQDQGQAQAMASNIACSAKMAESVLTNRFSRDIVGCIKLVEGKMPVWFSDEIYQAVASKMRNSDGIAAPAYDRHLMRMIREAFDENSCIQETQRLLNNQGRGLATISPPELISVRRELIGKPWRTISNEKNAGLERGSITIFVDFLDVIGGKGPKSLSPNRTTTLPPPRPALPLTASCCGLSID